MRKQILTYLLNNYVIAGILFVFFAWFLFEIRGIIISFFIAFIIMASLSSPVEMLKKRKVPNAVSVLLTYLTVLILLVLLVFPLVPFLNDQMQMLFKSLPNYFYQVGDALGLTITSSQVNQLITSEVNNIGKNAYTLTSKVLGGFFSVITILVVSFYWLLDRKNINAFLVNLMPQKSKSHATALLSNVEYKLGAWVRGQLVLCIFVGFLTWILLTIIGVPFALPLALIAGFLEVVPTLGPILAGVPAVMVAFTISPTMAAIVIGMYIGIQVIENHLLVPKIMQKAVGLHPVAVIAAVMIGASLFGVIGALLSIPFVATLVVFTQVAKSDLSANDSNR